MRFFSQILDFVRLSGESKPVQLKLVHTLDTRAKKYLNFEARVPRVVSSKQTWRFYFQEQSSTAKIAKIALKII